MTSALATRFRLLASVLSVLVLAALVALAWFYFELRRSLAQLDGRVSVAGLAAGVSIKRDALGVPTIEGSNRADVARALGFLHAQERFFQMDLLRRRAAGELAELFGSAALPLDRVTRPHRFRELARQVLRRLPPAHRELLESYTAGANAGLSALRAKPFEYLVLRSDPQPWREEDSLLIVYAMTLDLQDPANTYERSLTTLRDRLGLEAVNFFSPLMTPDDAALDGSTSPLPAIPGPAILNLRSAATTRLPIRVRGSQPAQPMREAFPGLTFPLNVHDGAYLPGSNSFALSGAHTANGAALLGNDPHLNLGVPNIWYRAVLQWRGADGPNRVVGVTLPGLPLVVLGSNGHVAWGLTDAYADTNDLVAVDLNAVSRSLYKVPGQGLVEIETHRDVIKIKGAPDETVETHWTFWGPIIGTDFRERPLAHHWVAYDPAATNLNYLGLESARTTADAIKVAHDSGIPAHSLLVADELGSIAWTIAGKFPKRVGFDGRLPTSWSYGDRYWDGFVPPAEIPTSSNPATGRLWTANNRLVSGHALSLVGDGGYATPPRAVQIRDRLATLEQAGPKDFLALQRDDRAIFLQRWQKLLLSVLTPEAVENNPPRQAFRRAVENWDGHASVDSVSYRLVKGFRTATATRVLGTIFAGCSERMPDFAWTRFNYEPALWKILQEKPGHLLPPEFSTWEELLVASADVVMRDLDRKGVPIERATWGARNRANIRHPFSHTLPPSITRWLNLPEDPLPGDTDMPLIQNPSFGASMRMAVSPGHEDEALFQMPGGQSGHPLSPFYRAGHDAWVRGEPSPLLPGETKYTLLLVP